MRRRATVVMLLVPLLVACSGERDVSVGASTSTTASSDETSVTAPIETTGPPVETSAPGETEPDRANTLRVVGNGFVLDQAAAYDADSWFLLRGLTRQLVTTVGPGADGVERLVADLATDTGTANADATEWTFTLRDGVTFGTGYGGAPVPGVTGRAITSADVKYAIERLFLPSVFAAYAFYYEPLRGAAGFAECAAQEGTVAACGGIDGIATPDPRTVTFTLSEALPDWPARMALPAATPVPADVGSTADAETFSGYSALGIATGPYVLVAEEPGQRLEFGRNEAWDPASDDVREANVDGLVVLLALAGDDAVQAVIAGQADLALGGGASAAALSELPADQVVSGTASCLDYAYLDTRAPPFDERVVREAVNEALPRAAIVASGLVGATVAPSILPPGVPGHQAADIYDPFGVGDGSGDVPAALARLAGTPFADGFDGTVVVRTEPGLEEAADLVAGALTQVGFAQVVPFAASAGVDLLDDDGNLLPSLGFNFWCWDFQDAVTFFEPLLRSDTSGLDYAHYDNADLDGSIAAAARLAGAERVEAWTSVNERATEAAMWVPLSWRAPVTVRSSRWDNPVYNAAIATLDWTVAAIRS